MAAPVNILAIRFSAMGDVAIAVPVIRNVLKQNPDLRIHFVSVPLFAPMFADIERLHFVPVTLSDYKGIFGMFRLARTLKRDLSFDAVADLHDVLRTKLLRFFLAHKRLAVIDKGRKEKAELTRPKNKIMRQLKTTAQRYADVFGKLNIQADPGQRLQRLINVHMVPADRIHIGIAPFAKHAPKMYPLAKMKEVVRLLLEQDDRLDIHLLAGKSEWPQLEPLLISDRVTVLKMASFADEIMAIAGMEVIISMDSANMHLASLNGVPVISVWGGTHPFLGFAGWGQSADTFIQDDLPCRPSSVFGSKPCPVHGDAGCMQGITPERIVEKTFEILDRVQKAN